MIRICMAAIAAALAAGCTMTPTVKKLETTMTMREIREAGLECRQIVPIDSNIPRTLCATPEGWESYLERTKEATDELFAKSRELANTGRFGSAGP
jgi:hypothetical protein